MTPEDEAFDDIEKAQQRKVAHGVTDGNKKDAALRLAREALENELSIDWTNNEAFTAAAEQMYAAIKAIDEALGDV
jgi:hypothetical protein